MQKKLIALAVAGLVSGTAFAQVAPNNIVLGGIIDVGFQQSWNSANKAEKSQSAIRDGGVDGSRFTISGTEDLGNGLNVGFSTEFDFSTDISGSGVNPNNTLNAAKSNLSLNGGFGSVKVGAFGSVHDDINGFSEAGGKMWGNGVIGMNTTGAVYNAAEYISPVLGGGFQAKLGFSTNNSGGATAQDLTDGNKRDYFLQGTYVNGPLKAGVSYDRSHVQSADNSSSSEWLISAGYDFGAVKLGAGYDRTTWDKGVAVDGAVAAVPASVNATGTGFILPVAAIAGANRDTATKYRINIGAPIGASDAVALSYSHGRISYYDGAPTVSASGYGLSYSHDLSKRTFVYASYGQIHQNDAKDTAVGTASYKQFLAVGLHHSF